MGERSTRSARRQAATVVGVAAALLSGAFWQPATAITASAVAADCTTGWKGGADFNDPANWDAGLPDASDRACISENDFTYQGDVLTVSQPITVGAIDIARDNLVIRVVEGASLTVVESIDGMDQTIDIQGGTVDVTGLYDVYNTTIAGAGAALHLHRASTGPDDEDYLGNLLLTGGATLDLGASTRAGVSEMVWEGGTVEGGGWFRTISQTVLQGAADHVLGDDTTYVIEHIGADWLGGDIVMGDGARLHTDASLEIDADGMAARPLHESNTVAPLVVNDGEIYKDEGAGVVTFSVAVDSSTDVSYTGDGVAFSEIRVDAGTLAFTEPLVADDAGQILADLQAWSGGEIELAEGTQITGIHPAAEWTFGDSGSGAGALAIPGQANPWSQLATVAGRLEAPDGAALSEGVSQLQVTGDLVFRGGGSIAPSASSGATTASAVTAIPAVVIDGGQVSTAEGVTITGGVSLPASSSGLSVWSGDTTITGDLQVAGGGLDIFEGARLLVGGNLSVGPDETPAEWEPWLGIYGGTDLGVGEIHVDGTATIDGLWAGAYAGHGDWVVHQGDEFHVVRATGGVTATLGGSEAWPDNSDEASTAFEVRADGIWLAVADTTAPTFPTGAEVHASGTTHDSTTLVWPAADDAGGVAEYHVFVPTGSEARMTTATSLAVSGLDPETTYEVQIVAVDRKGNASAPLTGSITTSAVPGKVPAGTTVASDSASEATPSNPFIAAVKTPVAGVVSVVETTGGTVPDGFVPLPGAVDISAPQGTAANPIVIDMTIDPSVLPRDTASTDITVFRNGTAVAACAADAGETATPDPCVKAISVNPQGDIEIVVHTSRASIWTLGIATSLLSSWSPGYRMVAADGGIFTFGDRAFHGSTGATPLNAPIVGAATDPSDNDGYWLLAADGGVFSFGTAFHGSLGGQPLTAAAVGIESTPTGRGYWIVLANGKVIPFGDATYLGDMVTRSLNQPVVGMTATPSGKGYWLVAADGGIFSFGDATFMGSMGAKKLNAPVIDVVPTPDGGGYFLLAADGGVFTFGNAAFAGSTGAMTLNAPVIGMLAAPTGGYWLVARDGGVFSFGVGFLGSMGATKLNAPVLDVIA